MQRPRLGCRIIVLTLVVLTLSLEQLIADTPADRFDYVPPTVNVPDGFSVQLVAAPPLLQHPMMGCFDDRGRLFIAEAAGVNLRSPDLDKQLPNSILMLEDLDGDGYFDSTHIFADKMTNPNGVQWHDGALYVASPPHIWRLRDTRGDGFANERVPIVSGFKYSGIANSLHGPVFAPDGRLYWMQGIGGRGGNVVDVHGTSVAPESWPGIFSCRPDGSDVRKHLNGGMDNPVEVAFTPESQMLGTVNLIGARPRNDAVVHWQWGGVYPRHDRIESQTRFARTGGLLPTTVDFGHVAVSGLLHTRSHNWGPEYQGKLFVTEFNTHRVRRVALSRQGSTYRGEIHEFLHSPNTDTHFTDVIEDADGSLLVIDTGGWFRNGCPVSQVAKPNIRGAIYRIRKDGVRSPPDSRGLSLAWNDMPVEELIDLLDDERFAVVDRAIEQLAKRGDATVTQLSDVLGSQRSPTVRRNVIWALCRMRSTTSQAAIRTALRDGDPTVREAAAHAVFENRDRQAVAELIALLDDPHPAVRREAATALGVLADPAAVPHLLNAVNSSLDRQLEHALIYALIEINDRDATLLGLKSSSPEVRRAALIALDQMPAGNLSREIVTPLLDTDHPRLQHAVLEIITRHKDWAGDVIGLLRNWLDDAPITPQRISALRSALNAFQSDPQIQQLVAETLADNATAVETRMMLLDVIGSCSKNELPAAWAAQLGHSLDAEEERETAASVAAVTSLGTGQFNGQLTSIATDDRRSPQVRVAAAAVVAGAEKHLNAEVFALLVEQFHEDVDPVQRLSAAGALAGAKLTDSQRDQLVAALADAGPLELPTLIAAFGKEKDAEFGQRLVSALAASPGMMSLTAAQLNGLLEHFPDSVKSAAKPLLEQLNPDAAAQAKRLHQLGRVLQGGDSERGRNVFFGKRASCSACHRVRDEGGLVGPDLSTIGSSRTKRDLLESIVFPNLSFAQGYETYLVETKAGKTFSGVLSRRSADAVHLRTAERKDLRFPRDQVEEIIVSGTSLMPQGLDRTLKPEELRDLLAYLASLRADQ